MALSKRREGAEREIPSVMPWKIADTAQTCMSGFYCCASHQAARRRASPTYLRQVESRVERYEWAGEASLVALGYTGIVHIRDVFL